MVKSRKAEEKGIQISGGSWRPQFPWEQIAWITPPWSTQGHISLDFPETVFVNEGNMFLSHINPDYPVLFPNPPKIPWRDVPGGIAYERLLPNGVRFGGSVTKKDEQTVALELFFENGSDKPMTNFRIQTCAYLGAIEEFSQPSNDIKFLHTADAGWITVNEAIGSKQRKGGRYALLRDNGPLIADIPFTVCVSSQAERLAAMTWLKDTHLLWANPGNPCFHADPLPKDLAPGEKTSVHGQIIFFEGTLDEFANHAK